MLLMLPTAISRRGGPEVVSLTLSLAQAFLCSRGLREVVPSGVLELYSAVELQAMLGGGPAISNAALADWKKHSEYGEGLDKSHPRVVWFWEVTA
jgi:hypothetical protein